MNKFVNRSVKTNSEWIRSSSELDMCWVRLSISIVFESGFNWVGSTGLCDVLCACIVLGR